MRTRRPSVKLDIVPGHSGEPYLVDPNAALAWPRKKRWGGYFPARSQR